MLGVVADVVGAAGAGYGEGGGGGGDRGRQAGAQSCRSNRSRLGDSSGANDPFRLLKFVTNRQT